MAVPKKRKSKSKQRSRRATHDKMAKANLGTCSRCGSPKLPHHVCPTCGYYKDRMVVVTEEIA